MKNLRKRVKIDRCRFYAELDQNGLSSNACTIVNKIQCYWDRESVTLAFTSSMKHSLR